DPARPDLPATGPAAQHDRASAQTGCRSSRPATLGACRFVASRVAARNGNRPWGLLPLQCAAANQGEQAVLTTDVTIIGAGAAGLMCAFSAAARGRRVLLLDHANKAGKKILMSGGGRCNFTNM